MKILNVRNLSAVTTAGVLVFTGVAILLAQPSQPQKVHLSDSTTPTVTTTDSTDNPTAPSTQPTAQPTSSTGTTTPTTTSPSQTTASSTSTLSSQPTTQTTQAPVAPAVTVVSANFAWGAPEPTAYAYTAEQGVCTYTYSDGTTQTVADGTFYTYPRNGSVQTTAESDGPGCDVSLAPPAN